MSQKRKSKTDSVEVKKIKENAHKKYKNEDEEQNLVNFSISLNGILEEKNIDQNSLAEQTKISASLISDYRHGKTMPTLTKIVELARALKVDCHYLLTGVSTVNKTVNADLGLSDKSIQVLQFLNSHHDDPEDEITHKQIIDLLNLVLESSYSDVIKYYEDEKELKHILETRYPDIDIDEAEKYPPSQADDTSDDPCPLPIENVFSTMYQYINPHDSSLSFLDGKNRITVSGAAATLDNNGEPTVFTVNELIRTTLFERIKKELTSLIAKEGK